MPTTSVKDIEPGTLITFRSKDANNTVHWRGTLESVGTYRSIRSLFNPESTNAAVRQTDPTVPSDVGELTYFILTVDNDAIEATTMVYADEWIEAGSLAVVNLGNKVTLVVEDPLNDSARIISILINAGYSSRIIS